MPLTTEDLQQILRTNPQARAVYTTGKHSTEAIIVVINNNHPDAGNPVAASFHGLPMSVRFARSFRVQPPPDPEDDG